MDTILDLLQGAGAGIGIGLLFAAAGQEGSARSALTLISVMVGAAAGAIFVSADEGSLFAGVIGGALGAFLAYAVVNDLVVAAAGRGGGGSSMASIVMAAAVVILIFAWFLPAILILIPVLILIRLAIGRRKRDRRKHEGLRVLR